MPDPLPETDPDPAAGRLQRLGGLDDALRAAPSATDCLDDLLDAPIAPAGGAPLADPAERVKRRLSTAKRDATGFISEALPHITATQLRWLTYRLESGDDREACERSDTSPFDVLSWLADPEFRATYDLALENKREGFKTLTSHLLPAVIRSLQDMLADGSNKDKKEAATLILRAQGLLIDKPQTADPSAITALFALLREERPVEARILDVRALPPPSD